MQLYNHQKKFLENPPDKTALLWSCGTGKTLTALLWSVKHGGNTMIICPKALVDNWKETIARQKLSNSAYVLSKELFRRDHKDLPPCDNIIVDEVHLAFLTPHGKSQMAKALIWYIKKYSPRILLLSATPYSSSPWNIYQLAKYLGKNWNWKQFNDEFFNHIWMGNRIIPQAKPDAPIRLAKILKTFTSVVHIDECMDVPEQFHAEPEYFALTKAQEQGIKENFDPLPIVRFTKQHQIEQGFVAEDETLYDNHKTARLMDLIAENPKVAVVCRYNYQIERLVEVLPPEYKRYVFNGHTKDRHALTKEINEAEKAVVFLQSETAEGYELPTVPLCIFMSMSYSYVKYEQICGRFLRMNNPSKTTFMYLLTSGDSVDNAVYNAMLRKQDFNLELYAKKRS